MKKTNEENVNLTEEEKLQKNIEEWKKQYYSIYEINIIGYRFIFRPLTRAEYKVLRKEAAAINENTDRNDRIDFRIENEEKMSKIATLYPEPEELKEIIEGCAGVADILSDNIMYYSGFSDEPVVKL